MQAVYKRAGVMLGFLVLAAVLLANAWLTKRQLESQIAEHSLLARSQEVLLQATELQLLLDDAETGQRGYLYTGKPEYLAPYNKAAAEIDRHIQRLEQITIENPAQRQRVALLSALARAKLGELQETISLYQSGQPGGAETLVLSDRGKDLMDEIRRTVTGLEQEEEKLEDLRAAAYSRSVSATRASLYLATFVAVAGLALLAYYVLRQMRIRERHAAELREREERYRVTLTSIGDAVIATDAAGLVTFLNPIAEALIGRSSSASTGKPIAEVFPIFNENTDEPAENPVAKVLEHGKVIGLANHTVLKRADRPPIPIEDSAAPIRDDRGSLIGVVLVFRDATPERKAQEIVRKAEKLAAASRMASTVAHEINNPLDAVVNLVYLAKTLPGTPPAAVEYLAIAEEQLDRVCHITKQTLAFYRESKRWESVDLIAVVDSALYLYSNKLAAKSVTVERDMGECPRIQGSPGELKQVVANLISNAADAVGTGGRVRVGVRCEPNSRSVVEFTVCDDGPGIAKEHADRIFEPFFTTKEDVGTGLGLWVAKEIVERHGGTIEADTRRESEMPGAVFTVRLPVTADSAKQFDQLSASIS
jgi:PAS domain S-box-containing protein